VKTPAILCKCLSATVLIVDFACTVAYSTASISTISCSGPDGMLLLPVMRDWGLLA
jgi:hypothetical protein